jgi:hypothetical protein
MLPRPKHRRAPTPRHQSCSSTGRLGCNSRVRRQDPACARTVSYNDALRDKVIVGTPASVVQRLQDLTGKLGLNGVLAELNCGGLLDNEKVMRSLQLMCEEVAPCFRLKGRATGDLAFGAKQK